MRKFILLLLASFAGLTYLTAQTLNVTINKMDVSCPGMADGIATANPTGGTPPYTFQWSNFQTLQSITNLVPGTYTVTVMDAVPDTFIQIIDIFEPPPLTATVSSLDVTCNGGNNGQIDFMNPSGGVPPYSYSVDGFNWFPNPLFNNLTAGSYNAKIRDNNFCEVSLGSFIINQPAFINLNVVQGTNGCNYPCNGKLTAIVSGGVLPYSIVWLDEFYNPLNFDDTVINLCPGIYNLQVNDGNSCSASLNGQYYNFPQSISANITTQPVKCFGGSDGMIDVYPSGGTPPYSFLWSTGATTEDLINVLAGAYSLTITDNIGCSQIVNATVYENSQLSVTFMTVSNPSCFGNQNGSISSYGNGGMSPYNFTWSNGSTNSYLNNLGGGTYLVTLTDINNCTTTNNVTLTEPSDIYFNVNFNQPSCGQSNGMAWVTGNLGYSYSWSIGSMNDTIFNLSSNQYSVTVYDTLGCQKIQNIFINDAGAPVTTISHKIDVSCFEGNNGEAAVSVTGGTPPFTYYWTPWGYTTDTIKNINAGIYTVTVTDANGCRGISQADILQPFQMDANLMKKDISCNGSNDGRLRVTNLNGGIPPHTFLWSTGATLDSIINLTPGTYTVTITDYNGCTIVRSDSLFDPAPMTLTFEVDSTCAGGYSGNINTNVTGGSPTYSYAWNNGYYGPSLYGMAAGTYYLTVSDMHNCTRMDSTHIFAFPAIDTILVITQPVCFGQSNGGVNLSVTGGVPPYNYHWYSYNSVDTYSEDLTNVVSGSFNLTVTDAVNCNLTGYININQPQKITLNPYAANTSACATSDGTASVSVNNGVAPFSFNWAGFGILDTLHNLSAGTYNVTVTDATGCTETTSVIINSPASFFVNVWPEQPKCFGGNDGWIKVTPSGTSVYSYNWSNAASTDSVSGLAQGTYFVTVTDTSNCSIIQQILLSQPAKLQFNYTNLINPSCYQNFNGSISLGVQGGTGSVLYSWSHDAQLQTNFASGLAAGVYNITVSDVNSCFIDTLFTLTNPLQLVIDSVITKNISCDGLSNGEISIYAHGGTGQLYSTIDAYWYNSFNVYTGLNQGNYQIVVKDNNNCYSDTFPQALTSPAPVIFDSLIILGNTCFNANDGVIHSYVSGGLPPYQYSIDGTNYSSNPEFGGLSAGIYQVYAVDSNGCSKYYGYSVNVNMPNEIFVNVSTNNASSFGASDGHAFLNPMNGIQPYTFLWSDSNTGFERWDLAPGVYSVTITDNNSCTKIISVEIYFDDPCQYFNASFNVSPVTDTLNPNGSISIYASGGQVPYHYRWADDTLLNSQYRNNLPAGSYTVTVSDSINCQQVLNPVVLFDPCANMSANTNKQDVSDSLNPDGYINVYVYGGTPPYAFLWNDGNTQQNRDSLPAGSYSVTVTDSLNCSRVLYENLYFNQCLSFYLTYTSGNVTDSVINNGWISVTAINGIAPLNYSWNDQINGIDLNYRDSLPAGWYGVTVTDNRGCMAWLNMDIYLQLPCQDFNAGFFTYPVTDTVNPNGGINVNVSGGTMPYHFNWADDTLLDVSIRNGLSAGAYYVTVSDSLGCHRELSPVLFYQAPDPCQGFNVWHNQGNVSDSLAQNGFIDVQVSGGVPPFSISWSDDTLLSSFFRDSLPMGTYSYTVYDSLGCQKNYFVTIGIAGPCDNMYVNETHGSISDSLAHDGWINLVVNNGQPPYYFTWADDSLFHGSYRDSLAMGYYNITVTDSLGCMKNWNIYIGIGTTDPCMNMFVNITHGNTSDSLALDGWIDLTAQNGQVPYHFTWADDTLLNVAHRDSLGMGNYQVTVTDMIGCIRYFDIYISVIQPCFTYTTSKTDISCAGYQNGSANVAVTGGIPPYTFAWSNGATTSNAGSLYAGTYSVTIMDSLCSKIDTVIISEPSILSLTFTVNNPACYGSNTGSIESVVSGGTPPYLYSWGGGEITSGLSNLAGGVFYLNVSDANNCQADDSVSVTEPAQLVISAGADQSICAGITLQLNAAGAATYLWSNGSTDSWMYDTIFVPTTFSVTGTDASGCVAVDSVFVDIIPGYSDTVIAAICEGNIYTLPNNTTVSAPGLYPVTFQTTLGCDSIIVTNLTVNPVSSDTVTASICDGATYTLPDNSVVSTAGLYPVTLLNSSGCDSIIVTNLTVNPVSSDTVPASICDGATYTLPDNSVVSTAGLYPVTLLNSSGCDSIIVTNLTVNPVYTQTVNASICEGSDYMLPDNSIVNTSGSYPVTLLSVSGCDSTIITELIVNVVYHDTLHAAICQGDSYTLPDNSVVTSAGLYPFNNVTTMGCDSNLVVNLVVNALPTVSFTGLSPFYCAIDSFVLLIGNNSTDGVFSGSGLVGGNVFNPKNATPGNNTITYEYTDANGCTGITSMSTTIGENPALSVVSTTDASCGQNNGAAVLDATGGVGPYNYSTGTNTLNNLGAGVIPVVVTDNNGCEGKGYVAISNIGSPAVTVLSQTDASCSVSCDGSAMLDVTGGAEPYTFAWYHDTNIVSTDQNPTTLCTGDNYVEITDALGCIATSIVTTGFSQPDPTIYGRVTYSGGGIDGQYAKLEIYSTSQHQGGGFDLMDADVQIGPDGSFIMANFPPDIYILKVLLYGNNPAYANLMNSYYSADSLTSFAWETADSIVLGCGNYKEANIIMHELFYAGTGSGTISGSITYPPTGGSKGIKGISVSQGKLAGEPVPGAEIYVELEPDDQPIANTETDTSGFYAFEELPEGSFSIKVEIPGFPMLSTYTVDVTATDTAYTDLNFYVDTTVNDGNIDTSLVYINNEETPALAVSVYPNPFSDYLNISYCINKTKEVCIDIFDITGRKIESIKNKPQASGSYTSRFEPGKHSLKPGTYFVQLRVDNTIYLKKVVMDK